MLELMLLAGLEAFSATQERKPPEFRSDVRLIRLDVSVVDRKGRAVAGLELQDFVVEEDGRPVELTYFQAIELPGPGEPPSLHEDEELAANLPLRRVLILVDTGRMSPFQLFRARESLATFFRTQTADGELLHLVNLSTDATWSGVMPDDRARLTAAARGLARFGSPWEGVGDAGRIEEVVDVVRGAGDPSETITSGRFLSDFAQTVELLDKLDGYLLALGGVKGRKALVLVSPGFPRLRNLDRRLERVASMAREAATAVYYVDAVGLDGLTPMPGQALSSAFGGAWARSGGAQDLADFTGGFTFRFGNSLTPALSRVGDEMRTYYVVGYVPERPADGSFREIDVEVAVPGLRARTKKGYLAGVRRN